MALPIVKLDGLFEAALGIVLAAGAAAGLLGSGDFPHPVGRALVAAAGCGLVLVGAVLWRSAATPGLLRGLAGANLVTAMAAAVWLGAAAGFSRSGSALVGTAAAVLALLGIVQLRAARPRA